MVVGIRYHALSELELDLTHTLQSSHKDKTKKRNKKAADDFKTNK